jgi:hypothetical protein
VVEYTVDESLDEMIAFVRLLVMDQAAFDAGRAKHKIPKSKIEVDDDGKQVVKILKNVFTTQRRNMGQDAKVSLASCCFTLPSNPGHRPFYRIWRNTKPTRCL